MWKCTDCAVAVSHVSQSANPYLVGFEIYTKHAQLSPTCNNRILEIEASDAVTLFNSPRFQADVHMIERIGGSVEISGKVVTFYRGWTMPDSTVEAFVKRLKKHDTERTLEIIVSTKDRP